MREKNIKYRSIFLVLLCLGLFGGNPGQIHAEASELSHLQQFMLELHEDGYFNYLMNSDNYSYIAQAQWFHESVAAQLVEKLVDRLTQIDSSLNDALHYNPDEMDYVRTIAHLFAMYTNVFAGDVRVQTEFDDIKSWTDWLMEGVSGLVSIVDTTVDADEGSLKETLIDTIDGVWTTAGVISDWIDAYQDLDVLIQDYSMYQDILQAIADNSLGECSSAALKMMEAYEKIYTYRLNMLYESWKSTGKTYFEDFVLTDFFIDELKKTKLYKTDESCKVLIDCYDKMKDIEDRIKASISLGELFGKWTGDILIGAENQAVRMREILALYEISNALQDELFNLYESLLSGDDIDKAMRFLNDCKMLIACRIRGEYCLTQLFASDSALASFFNREDGEKAISYYNQKVGILTNLSLRLNQLPYALVQDMAEKNFFILPEEADASSSSPNFADASLSEKAQGVYMVTGTQNYLALRSSPGYDESNEIGKLYNGDWVQYINSGDGTYWYIFSEKLGKYGYVNGNYLVAADGEIVSEEGHGSASGFGYDLQRFLYTYSEIPDYGDPSEVAYARLDFITLYINEEGRLVRKFFQNRGSDAVRHPLYEYYAYTLEGNIPTGYYDHWVEMNDGSITYENGKHVYILEGNQLTDEGRNRIWYKCTP